MDDKMEAKITQEELKNFSREELENLIIHLMNKMQKSGELYLKEYRKNNEKIELYTAAAPLLTNVNYLKNLIRRKNAPSKAK